MENAQQFTSGWDIRPLHANERELWLDFLTKSENATIFHDLRFLDYHPTGRFRVHNLLLIQNGRLTALLPAFLDDRADDGTFLKSPYGASFGGFVTTPDMTLAKTQTLVQELQKYVYGMGLAGIELTVAPRVYNKDGSDLHPFVFAAAGFELVQRWLTMMIPLDGKPEQVLDNLPSKRRRRYIRASLKSDVDAAIAKADELPLFYPILDANRAKHGARPTHTLLELTRIFQLVPNRARLFLCRHKGEVVAGTVVFEVNERIACNFSAAHDDRFDALRPSAVLLYRLIEHYTQRGFHWLDMGPTGNIEFDTGCLTLNAGGARFKEEMGAIGFNRDCWRWRTAREFEKRGGCDDR